MNVWRIGVMSGGVAGVVACGALLDIPVGTYNAPDDGAAESNDDGSPTHPTGDAGVDTDSSDVVDATVPDANIEDGRVQDALSGCLAHDAYFCADFDEDAAVGFERGTTIPMTVTDLSRFLSRGPPALSSPNGLVASIPSVATGTRGGVQTVKLPENHAHYAVTAQVRYDDFSTPDGSTLGGSVFIDLALFPAADAGTSDVCRLSYGVAASTTGGGIAKARLTTTRCPDTGGSVGSFDLDAPVAGDNAWHLLTIDITLDPIAKGSVTVDNGVAKITEVLEWKASAAAIQLSVGATSSGPFGKVVIDVDDLVIRTE